MTDFGGLMPTFSPDGKRLAYVRMTREQRGEIWVLDDLWNHSRLTEAMTLRDGSVIQQKVPAWSPDGTTIAYFNGVEMSDPRPTGEVPRDVYLMNADGSNKRFLVSGDGPFWSPDSKTVGYVYHRPEERVEGPPLIGGISPDGSNQRVLVTTNGWFGRASWGA